MATFSGNIFLLLAFHFLIVSPFVYSFSTVAISETANTTLICALIHSSDSSPNSYINCTTFPQGFQVRLGLPPNVSFTSIEGGNGFLCALSTFPSVSTSVMLCWRFSAVETYINYRRTYRGPILREIDAGNSHICGLVNASNNVTCWPWRQFRSISSNFSSNLAVGENFVCGLSDTGQVHCLGNYTDVTNHVPAGTYTVLRAGFHHACAISFNGSLECWGNMFAGKPSGEFTLVALGENRGCASRLNQTVVCWGQNFSLPAALAEMRFIALEAKREIFCGVEASNYSLHCWGNENFGQGRRVFDNAVPGPCRIQCLCPLPHYGRYCSQGLEICEPCIPPVVPSTPLPLPSPPPSSSPPQSQNTGRWDSKMVAFLVVGCVGSLSLLAVLSVFFFRHCNIRGSRIHDSGRLESIDSADQQMVQTSQIHQTPPVLEKRLSHLISLGNGGHLEEFSLQELLQGTDNFSEEHKIGTGSFGSVYHGTLADGREVAIKRAETSASSSYAGATKRGQEDKDNAFLNELEFLSRLNHKNLVRLLGYCEDSNELVLVYEYMNNGTLHDHLHKLENSPLVSWPARIRVALDAARGIEYLHEYAVPQIIHRDIKSSNILLDGTGTAKVSDFGLSLIGPQEDESHLSLHAAGTVGYMDPEYYRLQHLTTKSDVYSFGVLLLEMLSGQKAIHKNENGVPRNVVDYVVPYIIQDDVHRVLDRKVPPPTPFEIEAVQYVGYLAADCVMLAGRDRPTMNEVVNTLDRALDACLARPAFSRSSTNDSSQ